MGTMGRGMIELASVVVRVSRVGLMDAGNGMAAPSPAQAGGGPPDAGRTARHSQSGAAKKRSCLLVSYKHIALG